MASDKDKRAEKSELPKSEAALKEEEILKKWDAGAIFKKALAKDSPEGEFIFYEGPPGANGRPGIHHVISRVFKDVIPRYKTMRGFHVRRKAGWDTHGLPVEIETEKQLGLTNKKQIEEYGIAAFNEKCKESVWKYVDEWKSLTDRIGYWVNLDDAYVTYYPEYIESLWWITKEIAKRGFLYRDYKVLPWCPRCGTALSSHELAQGYEDVKDLSVTVEFRVKGEKGTSLLAWTTTPWTLPGNVALAVHPDIDYVEIEKKDMGVGEKVRFILAKDRLKDVFRDDEYAVTREMKGADLIGLSYEPLYDFLHDRTVSPDEKEAWNVAIEKAWKVYPADFVTTTDGTGIVHTAVMYGQDDFELGNAIGLPKYHLVDEGGRFIQDTGFLAGRFVKEEATDVEIIKDLAERGLLFKKEKYEHSYPHCWRCHTPLIYYARTSWYIAMSTLRQELMKENENINWIPGHIKEGRFGEWLREVKDWAISRDRYWGTPLPVWQCSECEHKEVIGSVEELLEKSRKSGNRYIVMRHGESVASSTNVLSSTAGSDIDMLTEKGKEEALESARKLEREGIDLVIASPFTRTRETVDIVAKELGIDSENIIIDERLREMEMGEYEGKPIRDRDLFLAGDNWYAKRADGAESYDDVRKRMATFIFDVDRTYSGKTILIVGHGGPLQMLSAAAARATKGALTSHTERYNTTAESHKIPFTAYPHNADFELDLHKPYIDEVVLPCPKCGNDMRRTSEVMDVWFDSGAMPFAQDHYPFENKEWVDGPGFPADYIAEGLDQTRGWFYTLHAVGVLLNRGHAYKNVVCLGLIMDAEGKKMSKSVGNVVDPWEATAKWGVDVLRFWMFSVNQPGDSKNYDEKTIGEVNNKVFTLLRNVAKFYEMYRAEGENPESRIQNPNESENVLDLWIRTLLSELTTTVTDAMDFYDTFTATRAIREFIAELSTWYVRRSRDRFKSTQTDADDTQKNADGHHAVATLRFVLLELGKLLAPFTPFFAEEIYEIAGGTKESVHLEDWPHVPRVANRESRILEDMTEVRRIVSLALEARTNAGLKVRQPLLLLKVRNPKSEIRKKTELLDLIRDEVNVKEVVFDDSEGWEVELDTTITPELKEEGEVRELIRALQDFRKRSGLTPSQKVSVAIKATPEGKALAEKYAPDILSATTLAKMTVTDDLPAEETALIISLADS